MERWVPSPTALPEFLFQKRTELFRAHTKLSCGAISRQGAVCQGVLARFTLGMEHLLPLTSVLKCTSCKTYTCALELLDPGSLNPTRGKDGAKMRLHARRSESVCGARAPAGAGPRARLGLSVTSFLYGQAEACHTNGNEPIHPLALHRLGELVRWHIEYGNREPLEAEKELLDESSSDEPGKEVGGAEDEEFEELEVRGTIMGLMETKCPACEVTAELGRVVTSRWCPAIVWAARLATGVSAVATQRS